MLVRLSNDGHYPDKIVSVTPEEFEILRACEMKFGDICSAPKTYEHYSLVREIYGRTEVKEEIPTILFYT